MTTPTWTRFWFESNRFFNYVNSPEDWEKVKAAFADPEWQPTSTVDELLDKAKVCPREGKPPKYGFAIECDGDKTLREFFAENGMAA
jgi:hypothetical protein